MKMSKHLTRSIAGVETGNDVANRSCAMTHNSLGDGRGLSARKQEEKETLERLQAWRKNNFALRHLETIVGASS